MIRFLVPKISDTTLWDIIHVIRKGAHVTEYAILALLIWRALVFGRVSLPSVRQWHAKWALATIGICFLYASSDEWHQSFVPSREARFGDVLYDTSGAVLAMGITWAFGRWRQWW